MTKAFTYTIEEAKQELENSFRAYLAKSDTGAYIIPEINRPPLFLVGPPGVGKTEVCEVAARTLNLGFVSYSLVHHTRNSLLGLPVMRDGADGSKYTEYTVSEIVAAVNEQYRSGYEEGVLFLDEFPCMSDTVTPVMLAFLQQKTLGRHKLPEGWIIVLAGNPPQYNKSVRKFDTAITDRLRILNIDYDAQTWLDYAEARGVYPVIRDYLSIHKNHLYNVDPEHNDETVTPRAWVNLGETLKSYSDLGLKVDMRLISQFIKCDKIVTSFWKYFNSSLERLSVREMRIICRNGESDPEYNALAERVSGIKDYYTIYKIAEELAEYAVGCAVDEVRGEDGEVAVRLENVFGFIGKLESSAAESGQNRNAMGRMFAEKINKESELLRYIGSHNVPSYGRIMAQVYDVRVTA